MDKRVRSGPVPGVTVIGLGNWGTSLVHGLYSAGIPFGEAVDTSPSGRHGSPLPYPLTTFDRARFDAAILWLCVPDSSISAIVRRLVRRIGTGASGLRGWLVVHSSGALSTSVLKDAKRAGASVASVHPLMSFPTRKPFSLSGVPFGVEADPAALRKLNSIVRRMGGKPFAITESGKAFYHAAGMLASPLLVAVAAAALEAAEFAGLSPRQARTVLGPIALTTLRNTFTLGVRGSFSGPIARGDLAAIHLHLRVLKAHPSLAGLYRSLALYALEALPARNTGEIRRLLQGSPDLQSPSTPE